jgi:hypothetical protein
VEENFFVILGGGSIGERWGWGGIIGGRGIGAVLVEANFFVILGGGRVADVLEGLLVFDSAGNGERKEESKHGRLRGAVKYSERADREFEGDMAGVRREGVIGVNGDGCELNGKGRTEDEAVDREY